LSTGSVYVLEADELPRVAEAFGVSTPQVLRDHLIAHLLGVIAAVAGDDVLFFGGTALALTHLPDGRLSEDVDLVALGERDAVATALHAALPSALLRSHGRLAWDRPLTDGRDTDPSVLRTADGLAVRIQLLSTTGYPRWPLERRSLHRRFGDAPSVEMLVPTLESFAAMKLVAWADRAAPRDLYDLWMLRASAVDPVATRDLFVRHGPTGAPPSEWMFRTAPSSDSWRTELAGQTRLAVEPGEALVDVRRYWLSVR
jgi:hypothetical protein